MAGKTFRRGFKLEAVRLVQDPGVSVVKASRDLDLHEKILCKWVKDLVLDHQWAFPGYGQVRPISLRSIVCVVKLPR